MMESPPFSTLSEGPPLSEDSGLLITSGSFSSDSASGWHHVASELQESDFDERSLSLCESTEASERMCGDFFNTVKKGPGKIILTTIEPPPEFQDIPRETSCEPGGGGGVPALVVAETSPARARRALQPEAYERRLRRFHSPRLLPLSPGRAHRPASRTSLCSRLSTSHNSLLPQFPDDSSFITQAISHDALHAPTHITDVYTVPFDSDIYAVPVDTVRPHHRPKKPLRKKRAKSTHQTTPTDDKTHKSKERHKDSKTKRLSLPGSSTKKASESDTESLHLTLREMRKYLHTLYSSSSDSECKATVKKNNTLVSGVGVHRRVGKDTAIILKDSDAKTIETNNNHRKSSKNSFGLNIKSKKHKESAAKEEVEKSVSVKRSPSQKVKVSPVRILSMNLKQSFCNLFRWKRASARSEEGGDSEMARGGEVPAAVRRALPPLPLAPQPVQAARRHDDDTVTTDFATSIQKVKDYGWYWGPISVEGAEKILSNEPDGSFIVRDSSDDHYIFTLTFKLNGLRHVRIEHDQGNFCFGGCTMFKAATIVEFIENAVETSRSGRYLFFLNLRPVLGPVRVQLLYPVSRFKRVQSLQHMCRFVILKYVRRDLIPALPLPRRLVDYLGAAHYYSELLADI